MMMEISKYHSCMDMNYLHGSCNPQWGQEVKLKLKSLQGWSIHSPVCPLNMWVTTSWSEESFIGKKDRIRQSPVYFSWKQPHFTILSSAKKITPHSRDFHSFELWSVSCNDKKMQRYQRCGTHCGLLGWNAIGIRIFGAWRINSSNKR